MEKKKILKWLIIILSIMLVICIFIIALPKKKILDITEDGDTKGMYRIKKYNELEKDFNSYNSIKSCINLMMLYVRADNKKAIEEISGEDYIFQNQTIPKNGIVMLKPVYKLDNEKGSVNFVAFKIYKNTPTYYGIIIVDYTTKAFKIIKSSEAEYNNALQNKINEKYLKYIPIKLKSYNKYNYLIVDRSDEVKQYFQNYIQNALYYPEEAYNLLDEAYRNNKFQNFRNFKNYLAKHREQLESLDIYSMKNFEDFDSEDAFNVYLATLKNLNKYLITNCNGYDLYSCIDDYGNTYVFKVIGGMQYSVYLDDYTIPLQDFIKKYNASKPQEKATLNINKFLKAVNEEDYNYAYGKLSEGFKKNYFPTIETFKQYVNKLWIDYSKIIKVDIQEKSNLYMCTVKTSLNQQKQFVVQLNSGTDYLISFKMD